MGPNVQGTAFCEPPAACAIEGDNSRQRASRPIASHTTHWTGGATGRLTLSVNDDDSSVHFVLQFQGFQTQLKIGGISNSATGQQAYAPGMILSIYGAALGTFAQSAATIPLPQYLAGFEATINGVTAPLYYVSPSQINFLIPNNAPTSGTADLQVVRTDNGQTLGDASITMTTVAPGLLLTCLVAGTRLRATVA